MPGTTVGRTSTQNIFHRVGRKATVISNRSFDIERTASRIWNVKAGSVVRTKCTWDNPNTHDILTGSGLDGRALPGDMTCNNWTSGAAGAARVGHHDKQGGGEPAAA
jgi:hypothetical protein